MSVTDISEKQMGSEFPNSKIIIERMQESDLNEVMDIERDSFSMPWSRQMFETELRETTLSFPLVARWNEENLDNQITNSSQKKPICGYSVFWHVIDEIHIGNLAVSPRFRRMGIASSLIVNIINLGQQWRIKRITLEVRQSNTSAINLYHSYGFREIAIRRKYYTHPTEDALVMVKDDFNPTS